MAEQKPTRQVPKLTLPIGRDYNFWYDYNEESDTVFVFVHGILSNALSCWTYEDKQDQEKSCYWPDLIREDDRFGLPFGRPSIYVGGYFTAANAGDLGISESAQSLFNALRQTDLAGRPGPLTQRNLVFVCHSTGGIVTRYLIRQHGDDLAGKAVGLVLIASPSLGSIEANKLQSLAKFYNNQLGLQLQIGDPVLDDLDKAFRELVYTLQTASDESKKFLLYGKEAYETNYVLRRLLLPRWLHSLVPNRRRLVPSRSANVYFGLAEPLPDTDHFETVKPSSLSHPSHDMLALFWQDFVQYLTDHQSFFNRPNDARSAQEALNAAGQGIEMINSLAVQLQSLLTNVPETQAGGYGYMIRHVGQGIVAQSSGHPHKTITAADLQQLPPYKLQYIRTLEESMKVHYEQWRNLYPKRSIGSELEIRTTNHNLKSLVAQMSVDLNGILSFLEQCGMSLDDHYQNIRHLVEQARLQVEG